VAGVSCAGRQAVLLQRDHSGGCVGEASRRRRCTRGSGRGGEGDGHHAAAAHGADPLDGPAASRPNSVHTAASRCAAAPAAGQRPRPRRVAISGHHRPSPAISGRYEASWVCATAAAIAAVGLQAFVAVRRPHARRGGDEASVFSRFSAQAATQLRCHGRNIWRTCMGRDFLLTTQQGAH
jgi:hypothetical protein